jgi:AcrR family transcriptional regulator
MSSPPPSPGGGSLSLRERKKIKTREQLLAAATELFIDRGYDATTVDEIAARAEVSRKTAFNYFPRKDDYLVARADDRRRAIVALLDAEQERPVSTADRLTHALTVLCDMIQDEAAANRALLRAYARAGGQLQAGASATAMVFARTIRHGQQQGDIRADVDAGAAGRLLFDAYLGAVIRWASDEPVDEDLNTTVGQALEIILAGLRP